MKLKVADPIITLAPLFTYLHSILLASKEKTYPWIMDNHVNYYIYKDGRDGFYERKIWSDTPFISETVYHRREFTGGSANFCDFAIDAINGGSYIYVIINQKHIKAYLIDHNSDHNMMIYGYDEQRAVFLIADFFQAKFSFKECAYNELYDAFYLFDDFIDSDPFIRLMRFNDDVTYETNIVDLSIRIENHLSSDNLLHKYGGFIWGHNSDFKFGLDCYDLVANFARNHEYRISNYHLFYDSFVMLCKRVEFLLCSNALSDCADLLDKCSFAMKSAAVIRNGIIKMLMKRDFSTEPRLLAKLLELKAADFEIHSGLLKKLRNCGG